MNNSQNPVGRDEADFLGDTDLRFVFDFLVNKFGYLVFGVWWLIEAGNIFEFLHIECSEDAWGFRVLSFNYFGWDYSVFWCWGFSWDYSEKEYKVRMVIDF